MKGVVKSIRAGVKRAAVRFARFFAVSWVRADGDGNGDGDGDGDGDGGGGRTVAYEVTMDRALAKALVAHYADDPGVGSVTDALRQAAREAVGWD